MARPKNFDEAAALQKALQIFWKKGYSGTSMAELTKGMQINAPSLYDTYGDKQQLFLAALQTYIRSQHEWMEHVATTDKPVREVVRMLLTALLDETLSDPERRGCFVVNSVTEMANLDQKIFDLTAENDAFVRGLLVGLIEKGQASGEITKDKDPAVLAAYLFTNFMGIRIAAITNNDKKLLEKSLDLVVSVM